MQRQNSAPARFRRNGTWSCWRGGWPPRSPSCAAGTRDPFAVKGETGRLYQLLLKDPFNTIAGIVSDEALKGLDADRKSELAQLVDALTDAASGRVG